MDERTGLPTIGVLAAGPLVHLMSAAAEALGPRLRLLADGELADPSALRGLVAGCDVVTAGSVDVPLDALAKLAAAGTVVLPEARVLSLLRDSRRLEARLSEFAIPADTTAAGDGRTDLITVVARSPFGQVAVYPVAEGRWQDRELREVIAPAPELSADRAVVVQNLVIELATRLGLVGIFTVTLRQAPGSTGVPIVTGVTMGPEPGGNWTLDSARTSQYEQWLRAVLDYPLGEVTLGAGWTVTATIPGVTSGGMRLDERLHHCFAADPGAKIHLYRVLPAPDRTIGHVTVLGAELAQVRARAARAVRWLQEGRDD